MADFEWRSAAAQTFVGGQITRVDGYWQANVLGANVFDLIEEYDLWGVAFGGRAKKIREKWKIMITQRTGTGGLGRVASAVLSNLRGKNEVTLGHELFDALKQDVVMPMQQLFNRSSLTINFKADGWFGAQPGFDSYTTMWDRKTTGADLTNNPDSQNPAHIRAKADRWALYGQFDGGKAEVARAGLNLPHVKKAMDDKTYQESWDYSVGKSGKRAKPAPGAPNDNQIFAALNYGSRKNGSSTRYGLSFFELADTYKKDALYFAMDTFTPVYDGSSTGRAKAERSKLYQVSAGSFGGAILLAIKSQKSPLASALLKELLESARGVGMPKPSTNAEHLLIEAHIFQKVNMTPSNIKCVNIARSECPPGSAIEKNLSAFKSRTGVPFAYID
jgi:hypothetical protein